MRRLTAIALLLALAWAAGASAAQRERVIFSRPELGRGAQTPAVPDKRAGLEVWVDDDWSGSTPGEIVGGHTFGTDAFAGVQDGIDAAGAEGLVNVYPGTYHEAAAGRYLYSGAGPYQFGLFLGVASGGITVRGVDATGVPIADYALIGASVLCTPTNSFGTSAVFVEADDAVITGLMVKAESGLEVNKTIEVIGENFTLRYCHVADWDESYFYGGTCYINDWRYDTDTSSSYIQSFTVEHNLFDLGNSVDIASGAGYSGPVSGRVIQGNTFDLAGQNYNAISFNGDGSACGWLLHPVGGAVIAGNSFAGGIAQYIKARGGYHNGDFDWAGIFDANAFDLAVCVGPAPPGELREYSYPDGYGGTWLHTRRIGTLVQGEVANAAPGDVVLLNPGAYPEQVLLDKAGLTLRGPNAGVDPCTDARGAEAVLTTPVAAGTLRIAADGVTVDGVAIQGGDYGVLVLGAFSGLTVRDCVIGGTSDDGINLWTSSGALIAHNSFADNLGTGVGGGSDGPLTPTTATIEDNCFANTRYAVTGYHDGSLIRRNAIAGYPGAPPCAGISGQLLDTVVADNSVSGYLQGAGIGLTAYGERPLSAHVDMHGNTLTGNGAGFYFDPAATLVDVRASLNDVHGNFVAAVSSGSAVPFDASGNWWGTTDGATLAGLMEGLVDYTPWLGGAGDLSELWASADCPQTGVAGRVQEAVDLVSGSTVHLLAGVFEGQVEIAKPLTLIGAGPTTVIRSPVTLPLSFTAGTGDPNKPIVYVHDATGVTLQGLTVDGYGRGNANYRFQGVAFWNAGGALTDCAVINVMDTPFSGAQHGVGVYANNFTGGPYTLALTNVDITGFQKNGAALMGDGLTVALSDVTATGAGPTAVTAQNGIQISDGAGGTLDGCTISDVHFTGSGWTATGLLLYMAEPVVTTDTQLLHNQINAYFIDASGSFSGVVAGASGTNAYDGIYLYNDGAGKAAPGGRHPLPQRFDAPAAPKADKALDMSVAITNSTITGAAVPGMGGIAVWGSANNVALTAADNTITNWDYGIFTYEELTGDVSALCQSNAIRDNQSYGFWSNTAPPADARHCWWGHVSGPRHLTLNPLGQGNEVSDNVLFEPWTGEATLGIVPPASGPLVCGGTQTLAFNYTPDPLSPPVKGYSIVVESSASLTFTPTDVVFTTLPAGALASWQATPQVAGHRYVLDYAVLLPPATGFTGPATLLTITFHAALEGTGTVHASGLQFRDVDNNPIGVGALGDATITVDCTAPAAVAEVTADPGHRLVHVDWTASASPDVASYEIWRAKWHRTSPAVSAYPEYDDYDDDAIPIAPTAYGDWHAEWTLAGSVATGTLTYTDTGDTNRGVYWYEVFAKDVAGNPSPPATVIDRATNYWLGDVRDDTPGPGHDYDGRVYIADITMLGANYGLTVPLDAVFAKLDVGPTDDMHRKGIPTTDSRVNFEDLMIFAMNFGASGPPAKSPAAASGGLVALTWSRLDDLTWSLQLAQPGSGVKGLNVAAALPRGVTARVERGALLSGQTAPTFAGNVAANGLDAGLAVFGDGVGIAGSGELLRVILSAAADLADPIVTARGAQNEPLEVRLDASSGTPAPAAFRLAPIAPNPFNPKTKIAFALPVASPVRLTVYALDGSLVRTLLSGDLPAGPHEVFWDGRDDGGRAVASGGYVCRLEAGAFHQTQKMTLMK